MQLQHLIFHIQSVISSGELSSQRDLEWLIKFSTFRTLFVPWKLAWKRPTFSSFLVISRFNTRCALGVKRCRMIKWRESRDFLYGRKFDWMLTRKIAKFQRKTSRRMHYSSVPAFSHPLRILRISLSTRSFFTSPRLPPDGRKTSFRRK